MINILPDHISKGCISEKDFELAYTNSDNTDRAHIKHCLAIVHRLHPEEPRTHAVTKKYPDAGLQIEQTQLPVSWAFIHCPKKIHPTHLAATIMVIRLASVKTCFVVFDEPPKAALLTALELCGQLAEHTFYLDDAQSCELLQQVNQHEQGRLVLLGDTPKALSNAALEQATPILYATRPENIIVDPLQSHFADHFSDHLLPEDDEHCMQLDPNLTPALFMEQTLLVTPLSE